MNKYFICLNALLEMHRKRLEGDLDSELCDEVVDMIENLSQDQRDAVNWFGIACNVSEEILGVEDVNVLNNEHIQALMPNKR